MRHTLGSNFVPENAMALPNRPLTSILSHEDKKSTDQTVKLEQINIKKPDKITSSAANDLNASIDDINKSKEEFSFERFTLKALGEAKVAEFKEEGPRADVDLSDPKIVSLREERKLCLKNEREDVQMWSLLLKILSVALSCMAIMNAIFSIVYIFVMSTNSYVSVIKNTIPLSVNLVISMWMLHIALKASYVSTITISDSELFPGFLRLSIITAIILGIQLGLMSNLESIPELLERTKNLYTSQKDPLANEKKADACVGLGYLIVWANCIFNLAAMGSGIMFTFVLRRHMRQKELYELEQKALPLGYQIHEKIKAEITCKVVITSKGSMSTSEPYKI